MWDDDPDFFYRQWLLPPELDGFVSGIAMGAPESPMVGRFVGPLAIAGALQRFQPGDHLEVRDGRLVLVRGTPDPPHRRESRDPLGAEARWLGRNHRAWQPWRSAIPSVAETTPTQSLAGHPEIGPAEPARRADAPPPGWPAAPCPPRPIEQARRIVSPDPGARAERERQARLDEVLAEVESLAAAGARRAAIARLERALEVEPHSRIFERLSDMRDALVIGARARVRWSGDEMTVVFCSEARIGRGEVEVPIPTPLLSREHALLRSTAAGLEITAVTGRVRLDRPTRVPLAADLAVDVEPWPGGGARVVPPSGDVVLVSCGPALMFGDLRLVRVSSELGMIWNLQASVRAPLRIGGEPTTVVDLCVRDRVVSADGTRFEVLG